MMHLLLDFGPRVGSKDIVIRLQQNRIIQKKCIFVNNYFLIYGNIYLVTINLYCVFRYPSF